MPEKILYTDDEAEYRRLVEMFLIKEQFAVVTADDGLQALELLRAQPDIKLVILDVMMPEMDGWQTCREIRAFSAAPVLMLTALDDVQSEVFGIENGADDYIAKPFTYEVFIARVKALLRRTSMQIRACFSAEGIELDETANTVTVEGERSSLTPKEFELLKYLLLNKGIVLSREMILDRVWGFDYCGDPRTVDTHIKSLRAKLGKTGARIATLRKKGYCYRSLSMAASPEEYG